MQTHPKECKHKLESVTAYNKLLICIPAYNEADNIGEVLDMLLTLPEQELFDILIIDDCSVDDTRAVCERKNVKVISHIFNMGYGAALKTAYKYAVENNYEYIIQMDADGQHDVLNIERIYNILINSGDFAPDIVIGSRFLRDSISFSTPIYKKFVIIVFNIIIKTATGNKITDPTSGLQGLNRRAFSFYAKFNQFAVDYPDANMIIQMALNDFTITEIPAVMHERINGVSMHAGIYKPFKYVLKMILSVLSICIRESAVSKSFRRKSKTPKYGA